MHLHFPDLDPRPDDAAGSARRPVAAWMLLAIIAAVLGAATVAASLTPDTRTFAQRHGFVPTGVRAL
ncbi:MAG TPA: hypothetical protein VFE23_17985 [Usitatibacter sp.]|jgi:hypothetical protein|nr:hypothetical protein [Usitatibacter sp.]